MNKLVWIEDSVMVIYNDQLGRYEVVFIHFAKEFSADVKSIEVLAHFDNKKEAIENAELASDVSPIAKDIKDLKERVERRLSNMK